MDSSSSTSEISMMTPYLHFTGGDVLLFKSLTPTSHGAIAAACIVLALLAIVERILTAARGTMEAHWKQQVLALTAARLVISNPPPSDTGADLKSKEVSEIPRSSLPSSVEVPLLANTQHNTSRKARIIAPFIVSHDIPRGVLYALQALLAYILMLAVMTFQAAYVIAIVVGLGVGEMLFGRFAIAH